MKYEDMYQAERLVFDAAASINELQTYAVEDLEPLDTYLAEVELAIRSIRTAIARRRAA